jgi:hypothetical protein
VCSTGREQISKYCKTDLERLLPEVVSQKADSGVVVAGKRGQELGTPGQVCFIRKSLEETGDTSIAVTRVKSLDDVSASQKGTIAASAGRQCNDGQLYCRKGRIYSLRERSQGDWSLRGSLGDIV